MPVGLSTAFWPSQRGDPAAVVERATSLGAAALLLDTTLPPGLYEALVPLLEVRRDELPVWAIEAPCPWPYPRRPGLGSLDRDEARAAAGAALGTIDQAALLGARWCLLRLGEVTTIARGWPRLRRAFRRGELDGQERRLAGLVGERVKAAGPHLEVLRRGLDRLAGRAATRGVRLGLVSPRRLAELPSPVELQLLLADLFGAPLDVVLDLAPCHLGEALGFGPVAATVEAFREATLALLADGCAGVTGLPPGRGEIDVPAMVQRLDPGCRRLFHPAPGLGDGELAEGLATLSALA